MPCMKSVVMGKITSGTIVSVWGCSTGHSFSWKVANSSMYPSNVLEENLCCTSVSQVSELRRKTEVMTACFDNKTEHRLSPAAGIMNADCTGGGTGTSTLDTAVQNAFCTEDKCAEKSSDLQLRDIIKEDTEASPEEQHLESPSHLMKEFTNVIVCHSADELQEKSKLSVMCAISPSSASESTSPDTISTTDVADQGEKIDKVVSAKNEMPDLLQLDCESDPDTQPEVAAVKDEEGYLASREQYLEDDLLLSSEEDSEESSEEDEFLDDVLESDNDFEFLDDPKDTNYIPSSESGSDTDTSRKPRRSSQKSLDKSLKNSNPRRLIKRRDLKERPKKRKKLDKEYVRCPFPDCDKIISNPQYLKRHIKYQHEATKSYTCSVFGCGRSFRFKTQVEEHERLHSDQRNYICEFCGRAFKRDKNLVVHRRIHTGEKPLQCEICGFTCRQKASLNWHMKKHNAESTYLFSCDVCGKRFEKRDSVSAHKSKSHLETVPPTLVPVQKAEGGGAL